MVSCDMSDDTWKCLLQDQGGNVDFLDWWRGLPRGLLFTNSLENKDSAGVILSALEQDFSGAWSAFVWKDPMFQHYEACATGAGLIFEMTFCIEPGSLHCEVKQELMTIAQAEWNECGRHVVLVRQVFSWPWVGQWEMILFSVAVKDRIWTKLAKWFLNGQQGVERLVNIRSSVEKPTSLQYHMNAPPMKKGMHCLYTVLSEAGGRWLIRRLHETGMVLLLCKQDFMLSIALFRGGEEHADMLCRHGSSASHNLRDEAEDSRFIVLLHEDRGRRDTSLESRFQDLLMHVYLSTLVKAMDLSGPLVRVRIKMWHGVVYEGEVPDSENLMFIQEAWQFVRSWTERAVEMPHIRMVAWGRTITQETRLSELCGERDKVTIHLVAPLHGGGRTDTEKAPDAVASLAAMLRAQGAEDTEAVRWAQTVVDKVGGPRAMRSRDE